MASLTKRAPDGTATLKADHIIYEGLSNDFKYAGMSFQ